jgi:subtilisin-like proprotein convertase family protein
MLLAGSGGVRAGGEGPVLARGAEWVSPAVVPDQVTLDMRMLPGAPAWRPGDPLVEIPRQFEGDIDAPPPVPAFAPRGGDPLAAVQRRMAPLRGPGGGFGAPLLDFDVLASTASPNDPTGDVGTHQFVAAVNGVGGGQFAIYDKAGGATVVPPTLIETLGAGGACAAGLGDPIVLFDELARRWLLTEFTSAANVLCVYLSDRPDLSGVVTWTRYAFTLPAFPDYPKYGVWPDAYYVGANERATLGARPFYAMDRVRMLAGQPATLQRLTIPSLAGFGFQLGQPADLSGDAPPPPGTPGLFMRHRDDEAHDPTGNDPTRDFLELYRFRVDWTTPANSAISGPQVFPIAEFSSNLNGLSAFEAFPQPGGQRLDPLREAVMHRLAYRRIGDTEILFGNFVTDLFNGPGSTFADDTGGVRWFELQRVRPRAEVFGDGFEAEVEPTTPWTLRQEGTYAPADGTPAEQADRWMAAGNVDADGNLALAYSVVRDAPPLSAGLRYTGRRAGDPPGAMTAAETRLVAGAGATLNSRWGDYNDMGIDPVDGCTFWFVGNYLDGARANRAAAFRHETCDTARFALAETTGRASVCGIGATPSPSTPVAIEVLAGAGFAGPVALSLAAPVPPGIGGSFAPASVATFPGTTVATLTATSAATPGTQPIVLRGTAGAQRKDVAIRLEVLTSAPTSAPIPLVPANGATRVDRNPTFAWQAVAGALGYVVEASTSSTFASLLFSQSTTGTSLVPTTNLPPATDVFWRVRATNACGGGTNSAVLGFTTGLPAAPTLAAPANGATRVTRNPTFAWSAAPGATGYVVEAATTNTFAALLFSQPVAGTSLVAPVALPLDTQVFWRVRGSNGFGAGPDSAPFAFTTGLPAAPTPSAPANGASGTSTLATFAWTAAAGATGYVVEASGENTFATLLFSQATTATSLATPVVLPAATQVFWRVRGTNGFGGGPDSAVSAFTTALEFCSRPNLPIPDNDPAGLVDTVVVGGLPANLANLDVRVAIDHTYVEDLSLRLTRVAPALALSLMANPRTTANGACSGNDVRATFDDAASTPAQTGCTASTPTLNGSVAPQQPLSGFNGQPANGTWRLTVVDGFELDTGSLLSWCLLPN